MKNKTNDVLYLKHEANYTCNAWIQMDNSGLKGSQQEHDSERETEVVYGGIQTYLYFIISYTENQRNKSK